jgi:glycosyltransferase involved in cell wall biosynthesis
MANRLSVVIACKNEAANIRGCIESARKVADEILVADSLSTDPTLDIVRQMGGCRVIQREFINFSNFKNWALGHCTHPWALVLDADERLSDELVGEIREILAGGDPPFDAYRVVSKIFFLGRLIRHSGCSHPTSIRFFRRAVCRFGPESVHESIRVDMGRVGWLRARLLHYTYRSLAQRTEKQNHYTTLAAQDKYKAGARVSGLGILVRPLLNFLKLYFWQAGFLDGTAGLIVCLSSMNSTFLKYAKLWEITHGSADQGAAPGELRADNQEAAA